VLIISKVSEFRLEVIGLRMPCKPPLNILVNMRYVHRGESRILLREGLENGNFL